MAVPLISVIITTYNHEQFIREAIESVLAQKDCPAFEIIAGNDCSTDKTGLIVDEYVKRYPETITHINRKENLGMQKNLKNCLEQCKGDFIAICEGDDIWIDPLKLKRQYECLMNDGGASMCFTDINLLFEDGNATVHFPDKQKILPDRITTKEIILFNGPSATFSCCMYKKNAITKVPQSFYENKNNFDFLFNLYVLESSYGIFIKKTCVNYRITNQGIWSGKSDNEKRMMSIKTMCEYNALFNYKYQEYFYTTIAQFVSAWYGGPSSAPAFSDIPFKRKVIETFKHFLRKIGLLLVVKEKI